MYMTNGKVPETIMTGITVYISHICEFGWYDWVMFRDDFPTFPDDKFILGRYLGPATNVGSALTAKIPKFNGQTVCRLTLRPLTNKEIHCPIHQELRRVFNETIAQNLGPNTTEQDFPEEELTPEYETYKDGHELDPDHGDLEVTPEIGDNYLSMKMMIP
jgi:hypothetical protein